jgi:hypothetical protein
MDLVFLSPEPIENVFRNQNSSSSTSAPPPVPPLIIGMVISTSINNGIRSYQIRVRSKYWASFVQYGVVEKSMTSVLPGSETRTKE